MMKCPECGYIGKTKKLTFKERGNCIANGMKNSSNQIGRPRFGIDENILKLRRRGFSISQVAIMLGCSKSKVCKTMKTNPPIGGIGGKYNGY